jgi:DNA-3-methyladenine glycosylase I
VPGPVIGEDGLARCPWGAGDAVNMAYHDTEWGMPVSGESAYLERLTLEAFQSGLSWRTILNKREAFREVFHGFDADAIAAFGPDDQERLMAEPRIVRNRLKIEAAVTNARATVALRERGGLEAFVESFRPEVSPAPETTEQMVATSAESVALSKGLKKQGFAFVGPTTMYALMEAIGLVDDHLVGCHRRGSAATSQ